MASAQNKAKAIKDAFNKATGMTSKQKAEAKKRREEEEKKDEGIFGFLSKKFEEVKKQRRKKLGVSK